MLIDTHCHLNMMVKTEFDIPMMPEMIDTANKVIDEANEWGVTRIINVGTSVVESQNCVLLAERFDTVWATVGIHPNDGTAKWKSDLQELTNMIKGASRQKIVAIGECGIDRHYPDYNLQQQFDLFRAQIELALEHDLAVVIHSRDAYDETLRVLEEYVKHEPRAVVHCFSYDNMFAEQVVEWGLYVGLGGPITYPKNNELRTVAKQISLDHIVLETDAPFLPPQEIRGKQNHPKYIKTIAEYLAELRGEPFQMIANTTTKNALKLFAIGE
ncbi:TatD family deoxyribonuclease [Candidatus Dependentiae bacterium]|nr:MAG: TatD family deoxyribonuclease [Candidatus Dependentiae bacterium]